MDGGNLVGVASAGGGGAAAEHEEQAGAKRFVDSGVDNTGLVV